ncbi:DUF1576 domain-containing protein [Petroclostridium sp. X23]|nr:DUF1576 domain-containing protein [Petroclostridium sp. X23]WHH61623.1 DUF1576 domain-containing protein [Petroclostridium sp. X23]
MGNSPEIPNSTKYRILTIYAFSFIMFGLLADTPSDIIKGLYRIIKEPGVLITDYIAIGGMGATFINAGVLTLVSIFILYRLKINIGGVSIASVFLMTGFALFGKNIANIWLIIIGAFLYAKTQKDKFSKYIYIALFGTSMAPTITEIMFSIKQPMIFRISLSIFIGLGIGFILPPLSAYLLRVHQGFNLYNVGFTAGIIGTVIVSVFRSYGFAPTSKLVWSTGNNVILGIFLTVLFVSMIVVGFYLNGKTFRNVRNIFSYSGRLVCDFVTLEGFGPALINMGVNGLIGMAYILLVGGDLNGPTIGGILTIVGFGAFGKHVKNMTPVLLGVFLGSFTKIWNINDPPILLAALFGTALAPIAGQFGWKYGMLAGFINSSVVLNVGVLHGGLNLYNTGFAAGIVAATMVPIIEALRKEEI